MVDETGGTGTDQVNSSVSFSLVDGAGQVTGEVENLTLTGALAINGTGNALVNTITGNTGANIIEGREGADTLNGGTGIDTVSYASSGEAVTVALDGAAITRRQRAAMPRVTRSTTSKTFWAQPLSIR